MAEPRCAPDQTPEGPLTGVWNANDGGRYFLRHIGSCLWWFGTPLRTIGEGNQPDFANVAQGQITDDEILLEWADVPLGDILGGGTLTLKITEDGNLVKVSETGSGFGGDSWTRRDGEAASPSGSPSGSPSSSP